MANAYDDIDDADYFAAIRIGKAKRMKTNSNDVRRYLNSFTGIYTDNIEYDEFDSDNTLHLYM